MNKILMNMLIFLFSVFVGWAMSFVLTSPVHADSFGSQCTQRNDGKMLCAFWQWDSKKQQLIRKEVLRARMSSNEISSQLVRPHG